jgi:hypothetical protein
MTCQSINPYDGKVLNTFEELTQRRNRQQPWRPARLKSATCSRSSAVCRSTRSPAPTVVYDPAKSSLSALGAAILDCGFHCSGEALPRYVCDGHALPEFRLAKALLENFRFETAIADAKELLTEKRCYSVAAQSISSTTARSTSRLRSRDTPRCKLPMLAATLSWRPIQGRTHCSPTSGTFSAEPSAR